jgi:hypothetical protein
VVDSEIIECPVCGNWRHKSWFSVGRRGCSACQVEGKEWLAGADRLNKKLAESEMLILKQIILDLITADELPPEFTDTERRILHGRLSQYPDAKIADQLGLKVSRMHSIEHTAQAKLKRIAAELMPDWIAAHN